MTDSHDDDETDRNLSRSSSVASARMDPSIAHASPSEVSCEAAPEAGHDVEKIRRKRLSSSSRSGA